VNSIREFPEMLEKRPLVCFTDVDGKLVVLGGNMRLKAAKELGITELPVMLADDWTEEQKAQFLIKDNVGFGEWNWDELQSDWDVKKLEDWGLDVPGFAETIDYSDKNEEIDIDALDTEMIIKLKYNEEEYQLVREQLSKIAATPEQAVWKLLGNE
jgi:ParB-like chromosome segregation protein Spo0J